MPHTQQKFLKDSMEYLGLTKNALAIKLNTSEFTINSWLMSEGRRGAVKLSEFIHEKISELVQEKKSANFFRIHTGTSSDSSPGQFCDKYQFRFPTLYRTVTNKILTDADSDLNSNSDSGIETSYTLSDQPESTGDAVNIEAIQYLDADTDNAWVFINEHSSMNAVLGYWRAISNSNPESISARFKLYLFEAHLFSIYHVSKPDNALVNNIVHYQIDDNEFQIAMPTMRRMHFEDWNLIIDSDGNALQKNAIWKSR